jgi:hypothetical protein
MQISRLQLIRQLNAELVPSLATVLSARHPDMFLTADDQRAMQQASDDIVARLLYDVERLEQGRDRNR